MVNMDKEDTLKLPDGSVFTRSGIVQQSIDFYQQAYQERLTDVTDFSDGSEIRTIHESFAVELFNFYVEMERQSRMKFIRYASGLYLDEIGCEYHLSRKKSEVATGSVTFTTSATINGTSMNIPKGTVILDYVTGYEYILQEDVNLVATDTPVNGTVYSKLTGTKYNAPKDRLRAFRDISTIRSEIKVTNPTEITGGLDEEGDEEFRNRILNAKREKAYGTVPSYANLIINDVPDVHDVQFVDPELLLTSEKYPRHYKVNAKLEDVCELDSNKKVKYDAKGNPIYKSFATLKSQNLLCKDCTDVLFVNAWGKPTPDDVLDEVEFIMTQQNNLVCGHKFHIERAGMDVVYLDIELFVTASIDEGILFDHLMAYFDGGAVTSKSGEIVYQGLNIGEPLYKARLIDVLEDIPSSYQVGSIKQAKYNPNIPTGINEWNNNGASGWDYLDDDGYTYYRSTAEVDSIRYWGTKNFVKLETIAGCVFQLGQWTDIDKTAEVALGITQYLVDENGTLLVTKEEDEE